MQVLCIQERSGQVVRHGLNDNAVINIGDIYTVIDEIEYQGQLFYQLSEIYGCAFLSSYFSPLSIIDETQLVNNKQEEYA